MSFTVDRYVNAIEVSNEKMLLAERLNEIIKKLKDIESLNDCVKDLQNSYEKILKP